MATLLLELFSEEIPSRMQRGAVEQLQRLVTDGFKKAGLETKEVKTFVSPRHLAIQVFGLPTIQPDVREERKGPKVGAPEQAMKGFLGSIGLTAEQCEQRDGYYFAQIHRKGRPTKEVVKEVCEKALKDFSWPKSMKWGNRPMQWVRPLHKIVCLLDAEIIPVQFGHLTASNETHGHRFLAPAAIKIKSAEDYVRELAAAKVMVDYAERRETIKAAVADLAKKQKLQLVEDEALLDEVTGLVEHPVPLVGTFDAKMLGLPPEVLISEMKVHQRYFALKTADGKLANQFIAVANMITADGGKKVIEGNARVLRARLADGEFYWEQDQKTKLEDWGKKLSDVVFHAKVGMMSEKVSRIEKLALSIAKEVGFSDTKSVERAAKLCKADLTSGMVGEFPDLQGVMGRYYATAQGEKPEVADAIRDHYKPQGAADSLPESKLASIIAVADRLDSITALFGANEKPTGSKDPFAQRRAALGVLRIILANNWSVNLSSLVEDNLKNQFYDVAKWSLALGETKLNTLGVDIPKPIADLAREELRVSHTFSDEIFSDETVKNFMTTVSIQVADFFRDRLKTMLKDDGVRHDIIEASMNTAEKSFNPVQIVAQTKALAEFTAKQQETLAAIKRAMNILAAEEKKSKTSFAFAAAQKAKFAKPAEQQLLAALQQKVVSLEALSKLAAPINTFFTDVMVTEEGHRDARLSLLAGVRDAAMQIADFSKIEG